MKPTSIPAGAVPGADEEDASTPKKARSSGAYVIEVVSVAEPDKGAGELRAGSAGTSISW